MRIILSVFAILLAPVAAYGQISLRPNVSSLTTYYTQVVPLVIVGEGWSQRIILSNVDTSTPPRPAIGTLSFYTRDAKSWQVDLGTRGKASTFLVNLMPGQTAIYETVVAAGVQQLGWAILQLNSQGLAYVFGQTVFRKQTAGLPDFMCSMVLGGNAFRKLSTFFDNTGGNYTGMAILTSEVCSFNCDQPVPLRVTVQDLNGSTITQKTITQKQGVLYWMNLVDCPLVTDSTTNSSYRYGEHRNSAPDTDPTRRAAGVPA